MSRKQIYKAFPGFVSRDPTGTERQRIKWMKKLNSIFNDYKRDTNALIKLDPELKDFIADITLFNAQANLKGEYLAKDMIDEAYRGGLYKADIISGTILAPEEAVGAGMGLTTGLPGMIGPANIKPIEILTVRTFEGVQDITATHAHIVKEVMTRGMLEGKGAKAITKDLNEKFARESYKNERLIRTEYVNCHNQAAGDRYQEYGFTHYNWSVEEWCDASGNCCEICPKMYTEGPYRFDGKDGKGAPKPPGDSHPNCRCSIYPVEHKEVGKIPEPKVKKAISQKSLYKKIAKAEETIKYKDYETAILYNSKTGRQIFKKKGNSDSVRFKQSETNMFKGNVLTHNHPEASSFSPADITVMGGNRAKAIRAVDPLHTHTFEITDDVGYIFTNNPDISKDFAKIRDVLKPKYKELVLDGTYDLTDSWAELTHELMTIITKDVKGVKYTRELIK